MVRGESRIHCKLLNGLARRKVGLVCGLVEWKQRLVERCGGPNEGGVCFKYDAATVGEGQKACKAERG